MFKKFLSRKIIKYLSLLFLLQLSYLCAQNHFSADPYFLLRNEKKQFQGKLPMNSNVFKPYFFNFDDSLRFSFNIRSEFFFNNNSPNQENMDIRYFSKGYSLFNSMQISLNSKYLFLIIEPYLKYENFFNVKDIIRYNEFSRLNDYQLQNTKLKDHNLRDLLFFVHYKGFGIGIHRGNRWWGPGIHSSLQMTNNAYPMMSNILGTMKELKIKNFGLIGYYSISTLDDKYTSFEKFHTALNGQFTWYGPVVLSLGFSRNYLSGGTLSLSGRKWTKNDAQKLVFEGLFTSNLLRNEYTVGGSDLWDQTLSTYITISLPKRNFKLYAEIGANDNRMYLADFISQPDHTMATIIGFRDYGAGKLKKWMYGFEWTNMMLSYTIRHRGSNGVPAWYNKYLYNYSSYNNRRWGAHSGSDSDDWLIYIGYLSDNFVFIPAVNYERHGIVSNRPAEVKFERRLNIRYKHKDNWIGIYYEIQNEMFLGFPDYFYEDKFGNPIDSSSGKFANSRNTNTLILSWSKEINF